MAILSTLESTTLDETIRSTLKWFILTYAQPTAHNPFLFPLSLQYHPIIKNVMG